MKNGPFAGIHDFDTEYKQNAVIRIKTDSGLRSTLHSTEKLKAHQRLMQLSLSPHRLCSGHALLSPLRGEGREGAIPQECNKYCFVGDL